jgi:histidinol-phosphatase (PHP family)
VTYRQQLHTHTYRCQHASGDAPDYARIAAAGGCRVLGMSDHAPLPDDRWPEVRMAMADLPAYEAAIARARAENPGLTILTALECEWMPEYANYYRDELLGRRGYHYLIGAGHYTELQDGVWKGSFEHLRTPDSLRRYADLLTRLMEARIFAFVAHPDIIGNCSPSWTAEAAACARDICAAAVATGTPLELNAYGIRKPWVDSDEGRRPGYPWPRFWEVAAEQGVTVVLNSDAHRPEDVLHGHDQLCALRDRFGLVEADLSGLVPVGR